MISEVGSQRHHTQEDTSGPRYGVFLKVHLMQRKERISLCTLLDPPDMSLLFQLRMSQRQKYGKPEKGKRSNDQREMGINPML